MPSDDGSSTSDNRAVPRKTTAALNRLFALVGAVKVKPPRSSVPFVVKPTTGCVRLFHDEQSRSPDKYAYVGVENTTPQLATSTVSAPVATRPATSSNATSAMGTRYRVPRGWAGGDPFRLNLSRGLPIQGEHHSARRLPRP